GVRTQHHDVGCAGKRAQPRPRLVAGDPANVLARRFMRAAQLGHVHLDHAEGHAELGQQFAAPRRPRGEKEHAEFLGGRRQSVRAYSRNCVSRRQPSDSYSACAARLSCAVESERLAAPWLRAWVAAASSSAFATPCRRAAAATNKSLSSQVRTMRTEENSG